MKKTYMYQMPRGDKKIILDLIKEKIKKIDTLKEFELYQKYKTVEANVLNAMVSR